MPDPKDVEIVILATHVGIVNRGAETFVIELAKRLSTDHPIRVYSRGVGHGLEHCTHKINCNEGWLIRSIRHVSNKSGLIRKILDRSFIALPETLLQLKFTLLVALQFIKTPPSKRSVIFPNNGIVGALFSKLWTKFGGGKWVYAGHGGVGREERWILNRTPDTYIALTEENKIWAAQFCCNVIRIPNGIDLERFSTNNQIKKTNSRKRVLSVAALEPFKRHSLTIQAVSLLPNVELRILGKGRLYSELKALGEQLLPGRFEISSVLYKDIPIEYQQADLFALPSSNEPFGIVYLEAMACGLPVVAQADDSRKEIIGPAGVLIECTDIQLFSSSIQKALNCEWGDKPRTQATHFSWESISEKYSVLFTQLSGSQI